MKSRATNNPRTRSEVQGNGTGLHEAINHFNDAHFEEMAAAKELPSTANSVNRGARIQTIQYSHHVLDGRSNDETRVSAQEQPDYSAGNALLLQYQHCCLS